jgi:hypothetical protein
MDMSSGENFRAFMVMEDLAQDISFGFSGHQKSNFPGTV